MNYKEVCDSIFDINKNIRCVGILNNSGKLIEGDMREGIESLVDEIHGKSWFNKVAIRAELYRMFNKIYGKTDMVCVVREKVKLLLSIGLDL